ncbi:tRNA N(3)-cytidine methyltransferase METTL2-like [Amphiura filiformis]|uniref:tRNA N(3)-cytidine methyltransferase METTL2-like n=1 Tax=Amphiura filiformis TaxID=82378 RepID=UPI003B217942
MSGEAVTTTDDGDTAQPKRPQFGTRFLTNPENVFQHNAWDNVSWDNDKLAEAQKKVEANSSQVLEPDMQDKYENEADQFWNCFYSQHQNRFFKDRHWLFTEFPELATSVNTQHASEVKGDQSLPESGAACQIGEAVRTINQVSIGHNRCEDTEVTNSNLETKTDHGAQISQLDSTASDPGQSAIDELSKDGSEVTAESFVIPGDWEYPGQWAKTRMLEVGCGVGNTVFPILQTNNDPDVFVYCCDFSDVAINLVKEHADYTPRRCHAFVFDITDEATPLPFPENSLDIVILIFVLSAVHPDKMQSSVNRLARCLKPGGLILLRDYGRYDMAQLRFKTGRCLSEHFYVRGDGTRVYFFTQDELRDLFTKAGLEEEQNMVDRRLQVNRGRQLTMYRVWIQCKYRKPVAES